MTTPSHYILVVDDDHALREALSDSLRLEGYDVVEAEHGEAALRHLRSSDPPCLILLDLMMPVMDGKTLRETMLKEPALANIPVVLITAAGPQVAASVRAKDVLHKPLRMGHVVDVVKEHCPEAQA
jgi:CheY-like chemotaxis protein